MRKRLRNDEIFKCYLWGESFSKISKKYKLSLARIISIIGTQKRIEEYRSTFKNTDPKVRNILLNNGINSLKEAKQMNFEELVNLRKIGPVFASYIKNGIFD